MKTYMTRRYSLALLWSVTGCVALLTGTIGGGEAIALCGAVLALYRDFTYVAPKKEEDDDG